MRLRRIGIGAGAAIVPVALACGWLLSLLTTRVANWFVMTDELYYERLAISVAQTGSPLPRIHGELVANVNQLYPVLISFFYGDGNVPPSFHAAHRLNAYLMASAAIPVFLLSRHLGLRVLRSLAIGVLAIATPWIVLSSFLLTEVVAYPAFCWALLALTVATSGRSTRTDVVALAAIALAVLARTQFLVLVVAFAVAVVADAILTSAQRESGARRVARTAFDALWRERRPLLFAYAGIALVLVVLALTGNATRVLGSYAATVQAIRLDLDTVQLAMEQVAILALGLAIVPFVAGGAWLVERLRPFAPPAERAFATVGCVTLVLLLVQVAAFSRHFGAGEVKDRYLFYVVPIVLVALAAAVRADCWPAWWALLVPTAVCVVGFSTVPLPTYEKLNADSPLALINETVLELSGSVGWAHVILVVAALVAAELLLVARMVLSPRRTATVVLVVAGIALPLGMERSFERLFGVNGTNGLPITLDQGVVYDWVDRAVGAGGDVSMLQYPVGEADFYAGVQYWWDAEFWNQSVVEAPAIGAGLPGPEPWVHEFDQRTGAARRLEETDNVLVHQTDVRFRLAGDQITFDRGAYIVRPERPWRAGYITYGIYGDGWTRPRVPATVRIFAIPGQTTALRRFLTVDLSPSAGDRYQPVRISSNLEQWEGTIAPHGSVHRLVTVCVPANGYGEVEIETPVVNSIYRDPSIAPLTGETDRPVGLRVRILALADENEPLDGCPDG